jgi:hydrogenase-4 component B
MCAHGHDLKRLLAFHSVENIGIICSLGAGMIFQTYGLKEFAALGLLAGLYHTITTYVQALLFLGAGSLVATHTRNMEEYGGLLRPCPGPVCFFSSARYRSRPFRRPMDS